MKIGKVRYYEHPSKTKCVLVDNQSLNLLSIDIWCKGGVSFEDEKKEGIAHFLEHMIFKGGDNLLPGEFDYKLESLGGSSNASTGYDDVHFYILIPPNKFKESLSLLIDLVLQTNISQREFQREKCIILEEIKQQNDQPDEKLFNYFLKRVWKNHFYSKSILGTQEKVISLNVDDLKNFHQNQYTQDNICIAIAGKLNSGIYKALEEIEIKYKKKEITKFKKKYFNYSIRTGKEKILFKKLELSRIFMAWQIPNTKDKKILIGFEILSSLLTEGRDSRLIRPLKEESNLVESIFMEVNNGEYGSILILEACCISENLELIENKINSLLEDFINSPKINSNELQKAINIIKSSYIFNLETASQLSSYFGSNLLWGKKYPLRNFKEIFNYWSKEDNFQEILKNLVNEKKFTLIAKKN